MSEWIKCDSCPAQAKFLLRGINGELTFCGHHKNKFKEGLDKWAFDFIELDRKEESFQLEKVE